MFMCRLLCSEGTVLYRLLKRREKNSQIHITTSAGRPASTSEYAIFERPCGRGHLAFVAL
eukprot:4160250-Pleurochrysis_carterae.AAC.3